MSVTRILSIVFSLVLLAACADVQNNPKTAVGTLAGAGLGALAGSQFGSGKGQLAAVAIGALGGAFLGSEVGKSLDRADRIHAEQAAHTALEATPSGQTTAWRNPDSGHSGSYTPTRTYQTAQGEYCRDFQTTVNIDGKTETATGNACRQPDGTWRIVR